jgi:hypothetical protein
MLDRGNEPWPKQEARSLRLLVARIYLDAQDAASHGHDDPGFRNEAAAKRSSGSAHS